MNPLIVWVGLVGPCGSEQSCIGSADASSRLREILTYPPRFSTALESLNLYVCKVVAPLFLSDVCNVSAHITSKKRGGHNGGKFSDSYRGRRKLSPLVT